jgi:hypothetical protein
MINRRLLLVAVWGWCLAWFSSAACVSVKAPERINIGHGDDGRNTSNRSNDRYDYNDNQHEYDYEEDRHQDEDDDDDDD